MPPVADCRGCSRTASPFIKCTTNISKADLTMSHSEVLDVSSTEDMEDISLEFQKGLHAKRFPLATDDMFGNPVGSRAQRPEM